MTGNNLEKIFKPSSVAVIGASSDKGKIGYQILSNIIKSGFKGKVYPINLKSKKILGLKAYPSVLGVDKKIDLVVICIPAKFVNSALKECGEKGIKNVIVISAGFKESGKEGVRLENEMIEIAEKFDMNIVGPNCLGVIDSFNKLNASFVSGSVSKGNISFLSQSGAIISAILDWADLNMVGFSKMVSLGNKAVLSESNFLEYLKNDKKTDAVFAYLEDIKEGKSFIKSVSNLTLEKPFVVIKPGTSKSSKKAMLSHTGAMTGDEKGIELALDKAGAIRVYNMNQLFSLVKFFANYKNIEGNKVAIITNAGGPGVIATDELEKNGLSLSNLQKVTKEKLEKILPADSNINNPVDVLGDAKSSRYKDALEVVGVDKNIDAILVILTPQAGTEILETAKAIADFRSKVDKPIVVNFSGGEKVQKGRDYLNKKGVAVYEELADAVFALGKAYEYKKNIKRVKMNRGLLMDENENLEERNFDNPDFMQAMYIIQKFGVETIPTITAFSPEEVLISAERIGYPLVMKMFSDTISHKTDVGGVKVGIKNKEEAREYFLKLKVELGDDLKGVLLQPMMSGQEIIVGVKKDEKFGHIIMFGLGGVYAEIMKDVSFALAPIDKKKALEMIKSIKSFKILDGYRSFPKVNIDALAEILVNISNLVMSQPEIKELDINPIIANDKECLAVDVRIINN